MTGWNSFIANGVPFNSPWFKQHFCPSLQCPSMAQDEKSAFVSTSSGSGHFCNPIQFITTDNTFSHIGKNILPDNFHWLGMGYYLYLHTHLGVHIPHFLCNRSKTENTIE